MFLYYLFFYDKYFLNILLYNASEPVFKDFYVRVFHDSRSFRASRYSRPSRTGREYLSMCKKKQITESTEPEITTILFSADIRARTDSRASREKLEPKETQEKG